MLQKLDYHYVIQFSQWYHHKYGTALQKVYNYIYRNACVRTVCPHSSWHYKPQWCLKFEKKNSLFINHSESLRDRDYLPDPLDQNLAYATILSLRS